jgi:integrase/recombinase XerD
MPADHLAVQFPAESPTTVPLSPVQDGAAVAAELVAQARAELPHLANFGQREELLAAAWLMSLRSARTRRAYAGDLRAWLAWLAERGVDVLAAGRVHADLWVAGQLENGTEAASVRRRLSALSSFYRYCAAHDLVGRSPTAGVARPMVDPDDTATVGLARDEARALVAAADADRGRQALRTAAAMQTWHSLAPASLRDSAADRTALICAY